MVYKAETKTKKEGEHIMKTKEELNVIKEVETLNK